MNVSTAIMAHPSRKRWVEDLQKTLGPVPVAWAQPPYATKTDRGPVWRTCRDALLLHGDAPFHCVLQDDAVLGRDFQIRADQMVEAGDYLYMLFFRHRPKAYPDAVTMSRQSVERGHFIIKGTGILGVGIIVPTERIADLVAFGDSLRPTMADDERMKDWTVSRDVSVYVPVPSLVNHRGRQSLVGHAGTRVAWRFA